MLEKQYILFILLYQSTLNKFLNKSLKQWCRKQIIMTFMFKYEDNANIKDLPIILGTLFPFAQNNKSLFKLLRVWNIMEISLRPKEQPFVAAFVACSLDPELRFVESHQYIKQYFITGIHLIRTDQIDLSANYEQFRLDQQYSLLIQRNYNHDPIIDVGNFEQIPQGWQALSAQKSLTHKLKSILCFKRGPISQYSKGVSSFQIIEDFDKQKIQEVTQPSLTYESQLIYSYVKIQIAQTKIYLNFLKKSQLQLNNLRFLPTTKTLYQREKYELDIPNIAILCFPEGVRIFKKETGFKFFTFILTTDSAQRFYCNCIVFSQKLQQNISNKIYQKFGIKNQRGIFSQKILTLISEYNCTDQTNKCLEYLYRIYLSKPLNVFEQKINTLPYNFKIDLQTNKSKYEVQDFGLCFKINTSYPQISTQAIYGVFKFLSVENIVTIVQNLLLERKIFFISNCQNIIGMAIQAFLSFIYPMNWIHGIINPLSSSMIEYTEAPMTIAFGLSNQIATKIKPQVDGLYIYLDQNRVVLKNNPQIRLMVNVRKQLIDKLKKYNVYDAIDVRDYLSNPQNLSLFKTQITEDPHFDAYGVRNIFFELTVFMLRNYKDYFLKSKKSTNQIGERIGGIKRYYNLNGILNLYKKDEFMSNFFQTSLFNILIEKKMQQPNNKWIKTLDRAIRKIASYKRPYIQEQSDNCSDNDPQPMEIQFTPKGCLGLIHFSSRQSEDQKYPKSSPSPKKSTSIDEKSSTNDCSTPTKNLSRMSLPNQYQKKQNQNFGRLSEQLKKKSFEQDSNEKNELQTDKGSESCDKSDKSQTPELIDNNQMIVYQFEVEQQQQQVPQQTGYSTIFCSIFSYPYKKMSNSVVTKWTKKKFNSLQLWKKKNKQTNFQIKDKNLEQPEPKMKKQEKKKQ